MRRRGDELHAGRRIADPADILIYFVARQLSAFAGFGSLRHLYLEVCGVGEVVDGNAEATGRDLFDRAVAGVAVGV